jgi:hypothetical protein
MGAPGVEALINTAELKTPELKTPELKTPGDARNEQGERPSVSECETSRVSS